MTSRLTCSSSISVFLWGHALLILGLVFFVVSFATDEWMQAEPLVYGLWRVCYSGACINDASHYFTPWMKATRAMHTMALMTYMVGVLLALFFNCTSQLIASPNYQGKARVLEVCTLIGNVLCFVGVLVYGPNADSSGTLKYSYGLSVLSLILSTPGAIMVACTRHAATGKNSGVGPDDSPHHVARAAAGVDAALPSGQYGNSEAAPDDGRQYSYGRGRHHLRGQSAGVDSLPRDGGSGDRGRGSERAVVGVGAGPYPYGSPYPDPSGPPAFIGQGFLDLPVPANMDGGAGDRGNGHYDPQSGGQRLPPISSVGTNPSAPPFPPDSFRAPPSYLEAIGMGGSHPQGPP